MNWWDCSGCLYKKGIIRRPIRYSLILLTVSKSIKKIGTAYVTSAMELTPQQKQAVEQKLLDTTKYVQFEIHYTTDPALIGGMVIRIQGPCCGRQCPDQTGTSDKRLRTYTIESR